MGIVGDTDIKTQTFFAPFPLVSTGKSYNGLQHGSLIVVAHHPLSLRPLPLPHPERTGASVLKAARPSTVVIPLSAARAEATPTQIRRLLIWCTVNCF